jgi:acetoin utilization deacetylase AcuC-like enzyme
MTALIIDDLFLLHLADDSYPERPERIIAIQKMLLREKLNTRLTQLPVRKASVEELLLCHSRSYVDLVQEETAQIEWKHLYNDGSLFLSTGDVSLCSASFDIASYAAGSVLQAVDYVCSDIVKKVFCAVRPPGHHADREKGKGFCIFNNAAIAARYAQKKFGLERVLIADWDVHHGDGTQALFEEDPSVFYFSTHRYDYGFYPGTGAATEKGKGAGYGTTLNCPFSLYQNHSARKKILHAFQFTLAEAMEKFHPKLIILSAGFDAHKEDPLGGCDLTDSDFSELTFFVKKLADRHCKGRLISVLEGGYSLTGLSSSVHAHLEAILKP